MQPFFHRPRRACCRAAPALPACPRGNRRPSRMSLSRRTERRRLRLLPPSTDPTQEAASDYSREVSPIIDVAALEIRPKEKVSPEREKRLYKSEICGTILSALCKAPWGRSSAGRAFGSHPRGRGFESLRLHQTGKGCRLAPLSCFIYGYTKGIPTGAGVNDVPAAFRARETCAFLSQSRDPASAAAEVESLCLRQIITAGSAGGSDSALFPGRHVDSRWAAVIN